jgi:hypothetical protein
MYIIINQVIKVQCAATDAEYDINRNPVFPTIYTTIRVPCSPNAEPIYMTRAGHIQHNPRKYVYPAISSKGSSSSSPLRPGPQAKYTGLGEYGRSVIRYLDVRVFQTAFDHDEAS